MKAFLAVVGGIVALAAIVAAVWAGAYYLGIVGSHVAASSARRTVTNRIQQSVNTPAFAQTAYEQFFNDCNAVVADNLKIGQAQQRVTALKSLPSDSFGQNATKLADALTDLTGLRQAQADTAARYNAAASEYTRGQFLAASLPAHLDPPYSVTCQ